MGVKRRICYTIECNVCKALLEDYTGELIGITNTKNDADYLNVADAIAWCKDIFQSIAKLDNIKDTREEIIEKRDHALATAKISNDMSDYAGYRYWDALLDKYDMIQEFVREQKYLTD